MNDPTQRSRNIAAAPEPPLPPAEQSLALLRQMQLIRAVEEKLRSLFSAGLVPGLLHLFDATNGDLGTNGIGGGGIPLAAGVAMSRRWSSRLGKPRAQWWSMVATASTAITGEIAATIAEEAFDWLAAPVMRIGARNVPIPFSKLLEPLVVPDAPRLAKQVAALVHRRRG